MEYYSVRSGIKIVYVKEFYERFSAMINVFAGKDYFKEKLKLYSGSIDNNYINTKSKSHIGISIHPFNQWQCFSPLESRTEL